jgi:hypothetical protein
MSTIYRLDKPIRSHEEVLKALQASSITNTAPLLNASRQIIQLPGLAAVAGQAAELFAEFETMSDGDVRLADIAVAEELHRMLAPLEARETWIFHLPEFWEWLAVSHFRVYALRRWCGGESWLASPDPTGDNFPATSVIERFTIAPGSVKSQSRHVVRRLYIYASCAIEAKGSYSDLQTVLPKDLDIPGAVFERKLGLNPRLAFALCKVAADLSAPTSTSSLNTKNSRSRRREFFKQVNLLLSTVAVEALPESELMNQLNALARDIV